MHDILAALVIELRGECKSPLLVALFLALERQMREGDNEIHQHAATVFHAALGVSQTVPELFRHGLNLMAASISSILRGSLSKDQSLHKYLTELNQKASLHRRVNELAQMLGGDVSESHFSFTISSLVVKGLYVDDCRAVVKGKLP